MLFRSDNPALDFRGNRAEGDDLLGDAYEYLMRHFATESGKSKGQFYTPSEVSRVIARVIGISPANTRAATTASHLSHIAPDANDKFAYMLNDQLKASALLSTNSGVVGSISPPERDTVTVPVVLFPKRPIKH